MRGLALGIDLGTSGVRTAVLRDGGELLSQARASYGSDAAAARDPSCWWRAVADCLHAQMQALSEIGHGPREITRIGVDGTSGSLVLTDAALEPVTPALMYSDGGFTEEAARIARAAPAVHITRGANSSLARALHLQRLEEGGTAHHLLHQADFIIARLRGAGGVSDETNTLKLGYDPATGRWPDWFARTGLRLDLLPEVVPVGTALGPVAPDIAREFGLARGAQVHAGTTDSLAAYLACAPLETGVAVTSLGTTLAVKLVSDRRIDAPEMGLYSHRLGGRWLVGGASNTGGGVLRAHFTDAEIATLSARIDFDEPSPLDYYPLTTPGERFPINDPAFAPRLTPRPESDVAFLHGLLEGMARIEARCYALIAERGGPVPTRVLTAGGGAANEVWTRIRARHLRCEVSRSALSEAAVGAARLTSLRDA